MVKIYGLMEKTGLYRWGIIPVTVKEDHPDLWKVTDNLKGAKIGIELNEGANKKITVGTFSTITPEIYINLYNRLKQNNRIQFLDNETIMDFAGVTEENSKKLADELDSSRLKRFKLAVKEAYFSRIKRTKTMIEKIKKEQPDVAFIGAAHAYDLYFNHDEKDVLIESTNNLDEISKDIDMAFNAASTDENLKTFLRGVGPLTYSLSSVENLPENRKPEFERERIENLGIENLYKIIETGTFSEENKKPNYVGSWSLDSQLNNIPLRGFFEVYVNNKEGDKLEGIIKDDNGNAKFSGILNENKIEFIKEYYKQGILFGAPSLPGEIIYKGSKNNGFYLGNYQSEKCPDESGGFVLFEYSPEAVQKILNSEDKEQLLSS